jgi:hypothetical protein
VGGALGDGVGAGVGVGRAAGGRVVRDVGVGLGVGNGRIGTTCTGLGVGVGVGIGIGNGLRGAMVKLSRPGIVCGNWPLAGGAVCVCVSAGAALAVSAISARRRDKQAVDGNEGIVLPVKTGALENSLRHCEERGDEAIQRCARTLDCFAPLAMTAQIWPSG